MINKNISIHLQDFPNLSFIDDNEELVANMDLVRLICSTALSIRDNKNLRVRLPLQKLIVIGKNSSKISEFIDIIKEEVNIKEIEFEEDIEKFAESKLQINFKKVGAKYGAKMKEISTALKQKDWKKISANEIEIAGIKLIDDEFELKLTNKDQNNKNIISNPLPTNDYLVALDIEITKELEDEGIARDIVRAIQQNRKDKDLEITNRIKIEIFSQNNRILEVAKNFEDYIKEQVLADEIIFENKIIENSFKNKLEDGELLVKII